MQDATNGLPLSEVTIAEALKPAYRSALIGKWHLGSVAPFWPPTNQGFDLFYGIPWSHDMLPLALTEANSGGIISSHEVENYTTLQQRFYSRAERFIDENRNQPFFLSLMLSAPHLPNYPYKDFAGRSAEGAYGDCVEEIDSIVGRLLEKLEREGLARNTLVIFTSDNGPWFEGSSGSLRQRKGGGAYDGSFRVPFIAWQPGTIPAGRRCNSIAIGIDFLPTLCAMAGMPLPAGVKIDGKDISAVLMHGAASPHDELLLFNDEDLWGLRTQDWSYVIAAYFRNYRMDIRGRGYPQLFDMRDPTEDYSVASLHPQVLEAMIARFNAAEARFAPLRTSPSETRRNNRKVHVPEQWRHLQT